jgi:hypothetical protein
VLAHVATHHAGVGVVSAAGPGAHQDLDILALVEVRDRIGTRVAEAEAKSGYRGQAGTPKESQ